MSSDNSPTGKPLVTLVPLEIFEALITVTDEDIEQYSSARVKEFLRADKK